MYLPTSVLPQATDEGLAKNYYDQLKNHGRFSATSKQKVQGQFVIRHYAGEVTYSTAGFIDKNKVSSLSSPFLLRLENNSDCHLHSF